MRNLFNYDNKVMSTINTLADSVILGILWLLCSLPIFTIGASSAAFYYAYNNCVRQKTGYAWKTFFSAFRSNFKQATLIWLVVLGLSVVVVLDWYLLHLMERTSILIPIIQAVLLVLMLALSAWALYLFPYLSRFENSGKTVMKNCALIAIANLPHTLLLLVVFALSVFGFYCLPLLNLFIPTLYMACANRILEGIFRKYIAPEALSEQTHSENPTIDSP